MYAGKRGFTLVEVIIVVAIIGVLSAISIPQYQQYTLVAKRAEVPVNVDGIRVAEVAYWYAFDTYVTEQTWNPDSSPGRKARSWTTGTGFEDLGWAPDGEVRGSYRVKQRAAKAQGIGIGLLKHQKNVTISGKCDVDGDGTEAEFKATLDDLSEMQTDINVF
jgi:prepilin-type N-terminal cleavage/methylation domain-containing protein